MDPLLLDSLRAEADGDRVLEAIIRLARPGIEIPDVRIVSRFGAIVTCRVRARDVIAVRARPDVISIKAARGLSPGIEATIGNQDSDRLALPSARPTDIRRSPGLGLTGAGVVVAAVDWGVDVDSADLRWPDDPVTAGGRHRPGGTRFLSFWDQRDQAAGPRPSPYGYGSVHDREEIDRALQGPRPYERLGYHPAIADPKHIGTHGERIITIAAGNGRAGGPVGIAPGADLIFVHLADRNTGGIAPFGDDVRLLEAVDFISRTAGPQPCAINISAGRICGPHNGTALAELAFDELLGTTPGRFICNSAGNYRRSRTHACGTIAPGEARSLTVVVDPADITLNEVEVWYDGADEFAVRIYPAGYARARAVCLGERSDLLIEGRTIGRIYHRKHDPNNGNNHIVAYLDPIGYSGNWTITLEARRVSSGWFHAWIERDDSCRGCQARFKSDDSTIATTIGSITTSHLPLVVGAYNGHDPARPVAPFSSSGPTADSRLKPDLVAPGVGVLASRSAPLGANRNPGTLVRGSGTSFATPHVTGAIALLLQAAGSQLSAHTIRSLVLGSCDPAADADPYRIGCGYLNIPRMVADAQRLLSQHIAAPNAKEPTMNTEDAIVLLAASPATAYREYLYRPHGQLARWIADRFDVVARPGQPITQAAREGDVLLEVPLGHRGPGQCISVTVAHLERLASRPVMPVGQLLLRPQQRVDMSEPLPVEPIIEAQGVDRDRLIALTPGDTVSQETSEDDAWRRWRDLILHRVPPTIAADLARRGISIPRIQDAYGDINLDYYCVRISKLPSMHGQQLTPESLLAHIRKNFNRFVDTNNSSFPPLDNYIDKPRWESDNPLGAVINIQIHALGSIDQGLVVCSRAEPNLWIFTTAHGAPAAYHPITGSRMWGIRKDGDSWALFTRGADRATQFVDWAANIVDLIWRNADALWRSFQARVNDFVNTNYGAASIMQPESGRWPWRPIQSQISAPLAEGTLSHLDEDQLDQELEFGQLRRSLEDMKEAAATGSATWHSAGSGDASESGGDAGTAARHYSYAEGVVLTPTVEAAVAAVANRYYESAKKDLHVNSGTRTAAQQATAMYDKLALGDSLGDYVNQDAAKEVKKAYNDGVASKRDAASIQADIASVITLQLARGVYISKHLLAGAVDIRIAGMTESDKAAFKQAVKDEGQFREPLEETMPPHWHLQLK